MEKIKMWLQKVRQPYDAWTMRRNIKKLSKAIWKYALKDSLDPKYTKEDAKILSLAIHWNDADKTREVLSYLNVYGARVFPR